MKITLWITLILCCFQLQSQKVEFITGININKFYSSNESTARREYSLNGGYNIGLEFELDESSGFSIGLNYVNYGGGLYVVSGTGQAGRNTIEGKINKTVMSIDVYPIQVKITNSLEWNFGLSGSILLFDKIEGNTRGFLMGQQLIVWDEAINERYEKYNSTLYFGIIGRIAYKLTISEKLQLTPYYSYYLGLTNDFSEFPASTKSMRHNIGIGVSKLLK